MYKKQGFYSGQRLKASQLNAMEDGIIEAQELAMEGAAGTANMEKGTGETSTQQVPRADKVTQAEGETCPHFNFTGPADAAMQGRVQYGAVGNYSATMNGRSAALNKHAFAINNSTVAKGEESFAQGYETVAEGNSSFAGGSRTWAKGTASVALGDRTKAIGEYSTALGEQTVAGHAYQTVVGVANDNNVESLFEVGNGELDENGDVVEPSTAFRVMRNGKVKIKDVWAEEDDDVIALGFFNHRLNEEILPQIGEAVDPYLILTSGREDKTSIQAPGCTASGLYSTALGHSTGAKGDYSVAIGKNVGAYSPYSIVMGVDSLVTNEVTFAVGVNALASGAHSRALGTRVNAGYVYQTVIGKDNLNKEGTLFEIGGGNGVSGNIREKWNVFEVYNDGHAEVPLVGETDNSIITRHYLQNNSSCVYTHFFQIILNNTDLPLLPAGAEVRINVNAISKDGNKWQTLSELDGKGYLISAFGTITSPSIDPTNVFELKLFSKDLNILLLNVHNLSDNSIKAIPLVTCGFGQSPKDYPLQDNVTKI